MVNLRWYNGKLQMQIDGGDWTQVPTVIADVPPEPKMCVDCGAWYSDDHVCWVKGAVCA